MLTVLVTRAFPWDSHGQISHKKTHSHAQGASGHILRNESPGMYSAPDSLGTTNRWCSTVLPQLWIAINESRQISSSHLRARDSGWRLTRPAQSHMPMYPGKALRCGSGQTHRHDYTKQRITHDASVIYRSPVHENIAWQVMQARRRQYSRERAVTPTEWPSRTSCGTAAQPFVLQFDEQIDLRIGNWSD